MIVVGLTGGIGSGKSTVAKVFEKLGAPVYLADIESKILVNTNKELIILLSEEFGSNIYNKNGLDKQKFASIIFSNKENLAKANSIIHPFVFNHFLQWKETCKKNNAKYVIKESAILFESDANKLVDYTITVSTNQQERIKRVCKRDNLKPSEVQKRIENQLSDLQRENLADFTIYNNEGDLILPQILNIHNILLERYEKLL
ncbi:MAG: dephospho-CoA kinase [Bacteroidales bacterium]|nr:dephospho-CoA kinase [Bacteroidales bacterium]